MADLMVYVRASEKDRSFVGECAETAVALVSNLIGAASAPATVRAQAIMLTGANLYRRRLAQSEIQTLGEPNLIGLPVRPPLDPLLQARRVLETYLGPGIA